MYQAKQNIANNNNSQDMQGWPMQNLNFHLMETKSFLKHSQKYMNKEYHLDLIAQSAGPVEYADCISAGE